MNNEECGFLIKQIHDLLEKNANNELRANGLTLSQLQLLMVLDESYSDSYSLKELEKLLCLSQATTAGLVKRLEQKGFVESSADRDDKRVKIVCITAAAQKLLSEAHKQISDTERRLLRGLTETEAAQFRRYLKKVSEDLK